MMKYNKNWIYKAEYKYGKYAIRNLMSFIVGGMAIVFLMNLMMLNAQNVNFINAITFDQAKILQGQIWRIISFIYIPNSSSIVFIIFSLYFYWLIGNALERQWGALRFNLFYLCGIIGAIITGMITGYATNYFLNLSLFLAFAILYPEFEIMLFFMIPVKVKWLGYIDAVFFIYLLIFSGWPERIAILVSVLNLILFFWNSFWTKVKTIFSNKTHRRNTKKEWKKYKKFHIQHSNSVV